MTTAQDFLKPFTELSIEDLEKVFADFWNLHLYGDHDERESNEIISFENWLLFNHWSKTYQLTILTTLKESIADRHRQSKPKKTLHELRCLMGTEIQAQGI